MVAAVGGCYGCRDAAVREGRSRTDQLSAVPDPDLCPIVAVIGRSAGLSTESRVPELRRMEWRYASIAPRQFAL